MKNLILILFIIPIVSFSQVCKKKYFEVIDTNKCIIVSMSSYNYASLYSDSEALSILSDSLPKLVKGIELEKKKRIKIDSIRVTQLDHSNMLIEDYEEENNILYIKNHKLKEDRDHHRSREKKWKNTSISQFLVIVVLMIL